MPRPTKRHALDLQRAKPLAWALTLYGILASLAANLLSANGTPVGYAVAAVAPICLAASLAVYEFMPSDGSLGDRVTQAALLVVAGVSGWISYWHIVEVALAAGESTTSAHLLPFAIDGAILVGSQTLRRIQRGTATATTTKVSRRPSKVPTGAAEEPPADSSAAPSGSRPATSTATTSASVAPPARPAPRLTPNTDREEAVAAYLADHPDATRPQVAERFGISTRSVSRTQAWKDHQAKGAEAQGPTQPSLEVVQ